MSVGDYLHRVTFQDRVTAPDGVGGYTETWQDLDPSTWKVQIDQAPIGDQERVTGAGVVTQRRSVVRGHYHAGVSTQTRMLYNGKTYQITGTRYVDARPPRMELDAVEQGTP